MKERLSEMARVQIGNTVRIDTRSKKEHHFGSAGSMVLEEDEALELADKIQEELGDEE